MFIIKLLFLINIKNMDFLLSFSVFTKFELVLFLISILYIIFHICFNFYHFFIKILNVIKPNKKTQTLSYDNKDMLIIWNINEPIKQESKLINKTNKKPKKNHKTLTRKQQDTINEMIKIIKTKIWRWEFTEAKTKIIEWLSIDKFNKELNCLLASTYEKNKDFKKAELIYKDLILANDLDIEIYLKLWFVLSVQWKYEIAYEIYKKLNLIDPNNVESIEMLANIWHHLGFFEESKKFAKIFLKNSPRHIDILYLQALNYINLQERKEWLEILKKLKNVDPYNVKVNELVNKLQLELELESNFNINKK